MLRVFDAQAPDQQANKGTPGPAPRLFSPHSPHVVRPVRDTKAHRYSQDHKEPLLQPVVDHDHDLPENDNEMDPENQAQAGQFGQHDPDDQDDNGALRREREDDEESVDGGQ